MAQPEWIAATAGGLAFGAGFVESKGFPEDGIRSLAATSVLVIVVSALGRTRIEPLVTAFAWLLLAAVVYRIWGQRKNVITLGKDKSNG